MAEQKHQCSREDIDWDPNIKVDESNPYYKGNCRVCGKEWHQVFVEADGLWDPEAETYVYI